MDEGRPFASLTIPPPSPQQQQQQQTDEKCTRLHDGASTRPSPSSPRRPATRPAEPATPPPLSRPIPAAAAVIGERLTPPRSPPRWSLDECRAALRIASPTSTTRCGAKTKTTGAPCRNKARGAAAAASVARGELDAAVAALVSFHRLPADELEARLRALARLVHCYRHDESPAVEARIDAWLAALSLDGARGDEVRGSSEGLVQEVMTLRRRLVNILGPCPARCTGVTVSGGSCAVKMSRRKMRDYERTVEAMVQVATDGGGGGGDGSISRQHRLQDLVRVLHYSTLCHHHEAPLYSHQKQWTNSINKFEAACRRERSLKLEEEVREDERQENISPLTPPPTPERGTAAAVSGVNRPRQSLEVAESPESVDREEVFDAKGYWAAEDDQLETSPFPILGIGDFNDGTDGGSPTRAVRRILRTPLVQLDDKAEDEVGDGFVYVYSVPGNDGLVKIGFTTRDVVVRHREWAADCRREPTLLYPRPSVASERRATPPTSVDEETETAEKRRVPHARRVEKLVHAELLQHRARVYCKRCGVQHTEWFRVSLDRAVAVIERWTRWIRTGPYEKQQLRRGERRGTRASRAAETVWLLRGDEKDRVERWAGFPEELSSSLKKCDTIYDK